MRIWLDFVPIWEPWFSWILEDQSFCKPSMIVYNLLLNLLKNVKNLHIFCCWVLQLFSILKYKRGDSQITSGLTTTHILPCRPTACANNSCKPVCWPCRLHSTGLKIKSSCTFYFQVNCIFLPSFRGDKNTLLFVFGAPCSIRGNSFTHLKHKSMMSNDVFSEISSNLQLTIIFYVKFFFFLNILVGVFLSRSNRKTITIEFLN